MATTILDTDFVFFGVRVFLTDFDFLEEEAFFNDRAFSTLRERDVPFFFGEVAFFGVGGFLFFFVWQPSLDVLIKLKN